MMKKTNMNFPINLSQNNNAINYSSVLSLNKDFMH